MTAAARFDRPIFLMSSPRSGSTLLFELLTAAPGLYSTGRESHGLIEHVPGLHPSQRGWTSNRLTADEATPETVTALADAFYAQLRDRDGSRPPGMVRMLEKTPKNALRVPFFDTAFPDAVFVYLYRDVRQTLASMIEAWLSGHFRTYPRLPGWTGHPWSLLLVPDWRALNGQPLHQIVARQWAITTRTLLNDLAAIPKYRLRALTYDALIAAPQPTMAALAASLDLGWDRDLGVQLPLSRTTVSPPSPDKWVRAARLIEEVWPIVDETDREARAFAAEVGLRSY